MKLVCCLGLTLLLAACEGRAAPSGSPPTGAAPASAAKPAVSAAASASTAAKPSAAAPAAAGSKFVVPYTAYSGAFTALWVAGDEGMFAKQGFDVSVQYMDASVAATALLSGETPFSSTPSVVNQIIAGSDVVILAKLVTYPNFSLYANKDIQKVEDLQGKTLADTQRGTAPDNAVRDLLAKHNLREGDLQFAYFPNPTAALAAMVAGQAVAAILPAPTTVQARSQGFHEVTTTLSESVPGIAAAISTKKERVKDNPASVKSYLTALKDATTFAKTNPDRTKAIIGKYAKTDVFAEQEETYKAYEPTWQIGPVQTQDIAAVLRYSSDPKAATADPSTFFDNSIVQSLDS